MSGNRETMLCRYHYDSLDRLVGTTSTKEDELQRFYCKSRLATEIQSLVQRSIFQQDDQLLAQQKRESGTIETSILVTDQQQSVLQTLGADQPNLIAYTPYGHQTAQSVLLSLLGFNGERPDPFTGHYLLGNGYRAFNPVLMRFNSPDSLSPFGEGGLNSYAYCLGDPINRYDKTGHIAWLRGLEAGLRMISKKTTKSFSTVSKVVPPKIAPPLALKNREPKKLGLERAVHDFEYLVSYDHKITPIKNIGDLRDTVNLVPGSRRNFILSDQGEIVVGRATHPVLSEHAASPNVITAGQIWSRGTDAWTINNTSNRYRPPYESLSHMKIAMGKMGQGVESIRHGK